MKTWLVTGSTGFVGQALRRRLNALGAIEPAGAAETHSAIEVPQSNEAIKVLYAKRDQATSCLSAVAIKAKKSEPIDIVIHLAGIAHVGRARAQQARAVNLDATLELLNAAINAGVRRFVYLSSTLAAAAEQGSGDVTQYGRDKLAVEQALLAAAAEGKIEVVILRSVNIYGAGMRGNIAAMISLMQTGRLPRLPLLGTKLSLVGVTDVAAALVAAALQDLDREIDSNPNRSVAVDLAANSGLKQVNSAAVRVTLTDGVEYSLNAIQDAIYAAIGRHPSRLRLPSVLLYAGSLAIELLGYLELNRSGISRRTYRQLTCDNLFDNTEAKNFLGLEPTTTFFEALPSIVEASQEN